MTKHNSKHHHKNVSFKKEEESIIIPLREERVLTAEGFRRRTTTPSPVPHSSGLCRGRKQGKKG